jgi:hypothetical protein
LIVLKDAISVPFQKSTTGIEPTKLDGLSFDNEISKCPAT